MGNNSNKQTGTLESTLEEEKKDPCPVSSQSTPSPVSSETKGEMFRKAYEEKKKESLSKAYKKKRENVSNLEENEEDFDTRNPIQVISVSSTAEELERRKLAKEQETETNTIQEGQEEDVAEEEQDQLFLFNSEQYSETPWEELLLSQLRNFSVNYPIQTKGQASSNNTENNQIDWR